MQFIYNDGGREQAGYKGSAGDCVCRAVAIVTRKPYLDVYNALNILCKKEKIRKNCSTARNGVYRKTYDILLKQLGAKWVPCMGIGTGCKVHLTDGQLPMGRIIVRVSKHFVAVINGVIHDTSDPQRNGTRCVYGYFIFNN